MANGGFEAVPDYLAQADAAFNPRPESPGIRKRP